MNKGAFYRWFDVLGNENTKYISEFDYETHLQIVNNIIHHRDSHYMSNDELKLVITIHDHYWSSYNFLEGYDQVTVWRLHHN